MIGGNTPIQHTLKGVNLIEAMTLDWRNPESWETHDGMVYDSSLDAMKVTGYHNSWLRSPIVVDTNKTYQISVEVMQTSAASAGLYFGGQSLDVNGNRATSNYDYTMATNYVLPLGQWISLKVSRTGTGSGTNGTSTSFSTIKGWKSDAGKLIKFYHFGALFNYNGGGIMYFRNPKIEIINEDNSGTVITNDGIAIEQATTNLIPSSIDFDSTVWGARENVTITLNQLDPFGGYNAIKIHPNSTTDNYFGVRTDVLGIGTYTTSIWLRASKECSVVLNTGTRSLTGAYITYTANLTREWRLFNYSGTTTVNPTHCFHIGAWNTWTDNTFDIFMMNPQVEQKAFATEYVNGSRSASGTLILPTNIGTDDFTVTGTFIPNYNSDSLANGSYFLDLGNGFILSTYNGLPFINGNVITGSSNQNIHLDYNTIAGDEVSYTIKRSGTTFTWNMKDSRQNITWTKVHSNVALSSVGNITFSGTWGGKHKNLSIYNRALSDSEVTKISKGTHSFTQDGLITNGINSKPNIPSDAFYYPLDLNSKDEYNLYLPSEDIGNYADGLYVGSGNSVEYNFNSSLGLDWNGDWSICYFKKPIGTHLGETNLTGYNIESFGCNSNTVGGGYLWFGKLNSSNSIEGASNGAITPDSYFNNWQCITIIKSGTSVTISTWLTDKISRDRTIVLGTISSNRFVTQHGYDFKLSGWDNTNPCHSYFRDLIVVKRAMTSDELTNYRNVKMKAIYDGLYIQNGINSTATL